MLVLIGGDSEIGAATFSRLRGRGRHIAATTRRSANGGGCIRLDLRDASNAWRLPPDTTAACILAGVVRPMDCAADPVESACINVTQTLALAQRLIAEGIYVLFLSSDQVFDGRTPHRQADSPTAPVSEYGRQKARTEAALRAEMARGAPVAILRLSKVVSPRTAFLRDWLKALKDGVAIRAFHDKTMAPVPIDAASDAIDALSLERACGIFQLTGPRDVANTEVARYIAEKLGADQSLIASVSAASAGLPPGSNPRHTTLDSTALRELFGIAAPDVWGVIDEILRGSAGNPSSLRGKYLTGARVANTPL